MLLVEEPLKKSMVYIVLSKHERENRRKARNNEFLGRVEMRRGFPVCRQLVLDLPWNRKWGDWIYVYEIQMVHIFMP